MDELLPLLLARCLAFVSEEPRVLFKQFGELRIAVVFEELLHAIYIGARRHKVGEARDRHYSLLGLHGGRCR